MRVLDTVRYALVDPITVVLLALGALSGIAPGVVGALLMAGGFYGIYRATRSRLALWLVLAPLVAYGLVKVSALRDGPFDFLRMGYPKVAAVPGGLGRVLLVAAYIASLVVARAKIGRVLAALTGVALAIGTIADSLSAIPTREAAIFQLLDAIGRGWTKVGFLLLALSWLTIAIAPKPDSALRPAGGIVAAVGACLLAAVSQVRIAESAEVVDFLAITTAVLGWILSAAGLATIARRAGPAGWIGLALVILQIFGFPVAMLLWKPTEQPGLVLDMTTGLGALGIGITAVFARDLPLREARWIIGGLFLLVFSASMVAWGRTFLDLTKITRSSSPVGALLDTPTFVHALVFWAAYLALLASPPREI